MARATVILSYIETWRYEWIVFANLAIVRQNRDSSKLFKHGFSEVFGFFLEVEIRAKIHGKFCEDTRSTFVLRRVFLRQIFTRQFCAPFFEACY
jgi:hypothetical protein